MEEHAERKRRGGKVNIYHVNKSILKPFKYSFFSGATARMLAYSTNSVPERESMRGRLDNFKLENFTRAGSYEMPTR